MYFDKLTLCLISFVLFAKEISAGDDDYNIVHKDGSYEFGYNNPDNYHYADANRKNVVRGEFGGRDPKTGGIDTTYYTAGPRGYRPRGKNVVRKYDLNQNGPRAVGSKYDPYYDPYEDPSYSFSFRTRTYNRDENANRLGDVNGRYSYIDDVGERHNVEFIAGKNTGFHVKTPFPDSNPRSYGPLYFRGRGKPIPRGRTSIQRGLDGSYKFVSAGPDQRRTETSDATGHVRGSYTYLDDKGVQHSVHYIAGPETGYRVLKTVKGPHLPTVFPFQYPDIIPPDFYDGSDEKDLFNTAASHHGRPAGRPNLKDDKNGLGDDEGGDFDKKPKPKPRPRPGGKQPVDDDFDFGKKKISGKPQKLPTPYDEDDSGYDTDFGDLFGDSSKKGDADKTRGSKGVSGTTFKPSGVFDNKPSKDESNEDSFGGSKEDGLYKPPKNGLYIPPEANKPSERPGGSSEEDYGSGNKPGNDFGRPSLTNRPGKGNKPPNREGGSSGENDDFGLFGSESNRPKPPYRGGEGGPLINVGGVNKNCPKCPGAIVTNVGDTYLTVPPGVSIRAHVQAIDLLPYSSRFPTPSDQYKADVNLQTEQLNATKDKIVSKNNDTISEETTENDDYTTEDTTEVIPTTISS